MHLLVRENRLLDEDEAAVDLEQTPADLVFLSFSDSDLGAASAAWSALQDPPSLRLASLARLRHPMSVDLYVDKVARHARCVVVRLLGGLGYWRYGVEELSALCRDRAIPLALLAGDGRDDEALAGFGTVAAAARERLDAFLRQGGPVNLGRALLYASHLAGLGPDPGAPAEEVASCGVHRDMPSSGASRAAIVFYRSHLMAGDTAPVDALAAALAARGLDVACLYVASLKDPDCAAFASARLRAGGRTVVLNATGFSVRRDARRLGGAPVLQLVLAGSSREAWAGSARGCRRPIWRCRWSCRSWTGSLLTVRRVVQGGAGAPSRRAIGARRSRFRTRTASRLPPTAPPAGRAWPRPLGTSAASPSCCPTIRAEASARTRSAWTRFASLSGIARALQRAGYDTGAAPDAALAEAMCHAPESAFLTLEDYRALFAGLPPELRAAILAAWGEPSPPGGAFRAVHARRGGMVVALQPDRGGRGDRKASLPRPGPAALPRLRRLPPLAAGGPGRPCRGPSRRARHAGMAAGQVGLRSRPPAPRAR